MENNNKPQRGVYVPEAAMATAQERKLGRAIASSTGRARRAHLVRYLQSFAAKIVAARAAVSGPLEHPEHLAKVSPWIGSAEPVKVQDIPKPDGGTRRIYSFGPEWRTIQRLLLNALNHAGPRPHSRDEVVQTVLARLEKRPAYCTEIDIVDCYGSVAHNPTTISSFTGLPAQVVSTLFCDAINVEDGGKHVSSFLITDGFPGSKVAKPRLGLPQGSIVSPAIVERLLTPLLELLPQGKVVRYVDNFLIMADSQEEAVSILSALGDALAHHPAGPFSGKVKAKYAPGDTVVFLGYAIAPSSGGCSVEPAPGKLARFEDRTIKAMEGAEANPHQCLRRLARIRRSIAGLPSGFRLWPDGPVYAREWLDCLESWFPNELVQHPTQMAKKSQ